MTEKISSITPCKECGNDENFEIIKIRAMTGRFIADCKCPECGTINTLELLAPDEVLKETNNDCKLAIIMILLNTDIDTAKKKWDDANGVIRKALG